MRNIQHQVPHFIVKITFRLLKITGIMFLVQQTATFNTFKHLLCFKDSLSDGVSEVMRNKVFHLKHIFFMY